VTCAPKWDEAHSICSGDVQDNLLAKCRSLNADGISAYHWCGGYRYPPPTITGDVQVVLSYPI
jgi:hypothetical protein